MYNVLIINKHLLSNNILEMFICSLGLVFGPQPNTYDVATYGYMTMIGCLYLCALR